MKFSCLKKIITFLHLKGLALLLIGLYSKVFPNQTITRDGIKYRVDLNKLIDFGIFIGGWEKNTIKFLKNNIQKGNVVLEIGANIGAHSLIMANLVGNNGHVIAVEPTQYAIDKLKMNISLNSNISNITLIEKVISDSETSDEDTFNSDWKKNSEQSPHKISFKSTTVDKLVKEFKLNRVDLLKIDVDGYDFKVLKGAKETIRNYKPTIFVELCEYTLQKKGESIADIFSFLDELEYKCFDENEEIEIDLNIVKSKVGMDKSINGIFRSKYKY